MRFSGKTAAAAVFAALAFLRLEAVAASVREDAQRGVALIDYISRDYRNAVSAEGGKILSADEYKEMTDFVALVDRYCRSSGAAEDVSLMSDLGMLEKAIREKAGTAGVEKIAQQLRLKLIRKFGIQTSPPHLPDLARGKELFERSCALCHGIDGKAHTAAARQFSPPPSAFHDPEILNEISPFQAFNTITYGIDDTPMPSFSGLSEEDRWALASYLFTFRAGLPPAREGSAPLMSWREAMHASDRNILDSLRAQGFSSVVSLQGLSEIRHLRYPLETDADETSALAGIGKAGTLLQSSLEAFRRGNEKEALDLSVSAYLDGFESVEAILDSKGKRDLIGRAEAQFLAYRRAVHAAPADVPAAYEKLAGSLAEAEKILKESRGLTPSAALIGSFFIIFREGIEAILLLAIIYSCLSSIQAGSVMRWFHASWASALAAGIGTWWVAQELISGSAREGMEGWIGIVAAVVLIYVSFWLLSKQDAERWKKYLLGKIKGKTGYGAITVFSIAFLAVYREAFETVLFLEALRIHARGQELWLWSGVALSAAALLGVAWAIFYAGKRIPVGIFFSVSGQLLYALAVIFAGQGIHNLQEANIISQTPVPFVTFAPLGIFPYLEGLAAQFSLLVLFFGAMVWRRRSQKEASVSRHAANH